MEIKNNNFQIKFLNDRPDANFEIISKRFPPFLNRQMGLQGANVKGKHFSLKFNFSPDASFTHIGDTSIFIEGIDPSHPISWKVAFNSEFYPDFFLWKVFIKNNGNAPIFIKRIECLSGEFSGATLQSSADSSDHTYFFLSNGWQSWSHSGIYSPIDKMPRSNLGLLQEPMVINPGTPIFRERGLFSSDFFGVLGRRDNTSGLLFGFLSQKRHFGTVVADIRGAPSISVWANGDNARLEPGAEMETDWAVICPVDFSDCNPLEKYLDAAARENQVKSIPFELSGWCSWYQYYQDISEEKILRNLESAAANSETLPIKLFQIDDGFQSQVGDWFTFSDRFPNGVEVLAKEIEKKGFLSGLWLAPFILHPKSLTAKNHPGWLLRTRRGRLSRAGFVWNSLGAALDLTVPGAMGFVKDIINTAVEDWKFRYLKLDFLYAAALRGRYNDDRLTRAQVLRKGMEAVRAAAGEDTFLLGCGAPLGSVLGLVDGMRVSADVSESWKPEYFGISFPFKNEPHMPSVRNALNNVVIRTPMHRKWWINDPDCLLVRDETGLADVEIRTFAAVSSLTSGSILLSDDFSGLPKEKIEFISRLLPVMKEKAKILDWLDSRMPGKLKLALNGSVGDWWLLAFINWEDEELDAALTSQDFELEDGDYIIRSFWDGRCSISRKGSEFFRGTIPPHGTVLLAVRKYDPTRNLYAGGNLHISQGLEVSEWLDSDESVRLLLEAGKNLSGMIDLFLTFEPQTVSANREAVEFGSMGEGFYRVFIPENVRSEVQVK